MTGYRRSDELQTGNVGAGDGGWGGRYGLGAKEVGAIDLEVDLHWAAVGAAEYT